MRLSTIGFTKKPASRFFDLLRGSGAKRVVDVRLNNGSQLAGFAKKEDLAFFLGELCGMEYVHLPVLAPTKDTLDDFKKRKGDWRTYEDRFLACASGGSRRPSIGRSSRTVACCAARTSRTTATADS